jgi:hypothetical protein
VLVTVTTAFALCLWIVLWSIGVKALDGMLLVLTLVLLAVGAKMLMAHLPGRDSAH